MVTTSHDSARGQDGQPGEPPNCFHPVPGHCTPPAPNPRRAPVAFSPPSPSLACPPSANPS
eukprot:15435193-Alexandrium_andersonii.AAC.1